MLAPIKSALMGSQMLFRAFTIPSLLFVFLTSGCPSNVQDEPTSKSNLLQLPGALQSLSTCLGAESLDQLEVRTAISGGILDARSLALTEEKDGTIRAKADFNLDGVSQDRTETVAIGIYGRVSTTADWVRLATLEEEINLKPNQENVPALNAYFEDGCGTSYDAKTGERIEADSAIDCDTVSDLNRNARSNLDDFCSGAPPSAPDPFLKISPNTVQFQSGINLGTFARQVVLIENLSDETLTLDAEVIGIPGMTIARLDPEFVEIDGRARRQIKDTDDNPFEIQPLSDMLLSLSYAPVNPYLAAGHLQISASNAIAVKQAFDVTTIGNADGELQPSDKDYDVTQAAATLEEELGLPLTPFPADHLFSGLTFIPEALSNTNGDNKIGSFPVDAAYFFEIPSDYRFSISLNGLATDLDLGFFVLDEAGNVSETFLSQNMGLSSESLEWRNVTESKVAAILAINKVNANRTAETNDGALTIFQSLESDILNEDTNEDDTTDAYSLGALLFSGPEFSQNEPMSPTVGPYEGGSTISLYGRGFQPGAEVFVGESKAFDTQVLNDGTEVRFTLPALAGGAQTTPVSVVLLNPSASDTFPDGDGQACTLTESFSYLPPKPILTNVYPNTASTVGGTPVTFSGAYFTNTFGTPIICVNANRVTTPITLISATEIQFEAPAYEGVVDGATEQVLLTVRNWLVDETTLAPSERPSDTVLCNSNSITYASEFSNQIALTYQAPPANSPQPVITSLSANVGTIDGGEQIVISGADFRIGALVYFGTTPGIAPTLLATAAETPELTQIEVTTPTSTSAGAVDIKVVNLDDGQISNAVTFTYETPAPVIMSILPHNGTTAGENIIAIEGSGFRQSTDNLYPEISFKNEGQSYVATSVQFLNTGRVLATTPAGMDAGNYTVEIKNEDGQIADSGTLQQLYLQDPLGPAPLIEGISPNTGEISALTEVTITGNYFVPTNELIVLVGGEIPGGSISKSETSVSFTMPTALSEGAVTIRVINPDGQSDTVTYTYVTDTVPAPVLDNINQTEFQIANDENTNALALSFTQVQQNAHLAIRPNVIELSNITPNTDGTFSKTINTPCPTSGPYVVELTNPDNQSVSVAYYCHAAAGPIAFNVTPATLPLNRPLKETTLTLWGTGLGDLVANNPNLQAQLSLTNDDNPAHTLSTVSERTEVPAYFQLQQSSSDNTYFYVERVDELTFETELSLDNDSPFLPITLKSTEIAAPLVGYDGNSTGDTITGYVYVMRVEEEYRQYLQPGTEFYKWKVFFSPIKLESVPPHANLEMSDIYECSDLGDNSDESNDSLVIASSATGEVDTTSGYPLHRADFNNITGCTGTVLEGDFSCSTNITSVVCGPNYSGQNVLVTVSNLEAMAPAIHNPYEILLQAHPDNADTALLHFGKFTSLSTKETPFANHEYASFSIELHDTTDDTATTLGQGVFEGYEYEFNPEPFFNSYFYTVDIPINHLEGHEHVCSTQEIEPAYTIGQVTVSDATMEGDYLNKTYAGTIGDLGYDFYVDAAGQYIAHARTEATPSPYASFYSQENYYVIVYDASVEGWRFHYTSNLSASYWTSAESINFDGNGASGWETLGGAYGQYPSGTHDGDEGIGTITYTESENVPALFRIESAVNGSMSLPQQMPAVLLVKDVMRLSTDIVSDAAFYNEGFCIKPMNQDHCQIDSCDERTVIHFTGDYEQLSVTLERGSD